jgi:hypothetical protein
LLAVLPPGQRTEIYLFKWIDAWCDGRWRRAHRTGRAPGGRAAADRRILLAGLERAACEDEPPGEKNQPSQMFYHRFSDESRKYSDVSSGLWIIVLEAGLALALLGFIVWWTLPGKSTGQDERTSNRSDDGSPRP